MEMFYMRYETVERIVGRPKLLILGVGMQSVRCVHFTLSNNNITHT